MKSLILSTLGKKKAKQCKNDNPPVDHRTCHTFAKGADWQKDPTSWGDVETCAFMRAVIARAIKTLQKNRELKNEK